MYQTFRVSNDKDKGKSAKPNDAKKDMEVTEEAKGKPEQKGDMEIDS